MTLSEAFGVRVGDYVTHKHTTVSRMPIRVTARWVNPAGTIILFRLAAIDPNAWLDATGYDLVPDGHVWDRQNFEWVSKDELTFRKQTGATK